MLDGFKSPFKGLASPFGSRRGPKATPVNDSAPVVSGLPGVGQTLTTTNGMWTAIPTPIFSYQWKSGVSNVGSNQNTYSPVSGDIGANITCVVTATNSQGSANATSNAIGPIVAQPANTVAPVISGTTTVGQTLTTTNGTWTGSPSYTYQWKAGGVSIAGATASTYVLTIAEAGASITCTVTGTNTGGSVSANSNALSPINASPVNSVLPAISGTTTAGQTLSVTNGTWLGYPASYSYAYQWKEDGANISGATSSTYALQAAQAGKTITCTVTATNSTGSTAATSAGVGPASSDPVNAVLPAITGLTQVGQTLTCSTGTWYAYPTATYTYQWKADGVNISGATSSTYVLTTSEEGDTITCVVTAINALAPSGVTATATGVGPISAEAAVAGTGERAMEDGFVRLMEDGTTRKMESYTTDVISNLVITPLTGGTTASFTLDCSALSGTLYVIALADGSSTPLETDIEDYAVDFAADGSPPALWGAVVELSSIDDYTPGIEGLIQNTTYDFHVVVRLTSTPGDYSNVISTEFTMLDGPPVLSSIQANFISTTQGLFGVTTDDPNGSIKWAVYPSASTPTKANILAGTGGALDYGSISVSGAGRYSESLFDGLTAGSSYKVHAYQIDAATNESDIITSSAFTMPASETAFTTPSAFSTLTAGATTGLSLSFLTATTSQADPRGGTNAVTFSHNPAGSATNCNVLRSPQTCFEGQNTFRFYIKKNSWASAQAWIRWRMTNITADAIFNFDLDNGTFAGVGAAISNQTAVKLAGGWWHVQFNCNLNPTGAADDVNGAINLYLASLSSNNSITTSGTHSISLFDYRGAY